jgi:hypothetical protein
MHDANMREMKERGRLNTSGLKEWPKRNPQNKFKTHCKRGHLLAGENLYVSPKRKRMCAACEKNRKLARRYPRLFVEPREKPIQTALEFEP